MNPNEEPYAMDAVTAQISPNNLATATEGGIVPATLVVVQSLKQQIVWLPAFRLGAIDRVEITLGGNPQPFTGTLNGDVLTLPAAQSGNIVSGRILATVTFPVGGPTSYNYKYKLFGKNGAPPVLNAGIRIDP